MCLIATFKTERKELSEDTVNGRECVLLCVSVCVQVSQVTRLISGSQQTLTQSLLHQVAPTPHIWLQNQLRTDSVFDYSYSLTQS